MGGAVSVSTNNDDMITKLINASYIRSHLVEQAFRAVDRANYVIEESTAYSDHAWKTDYLHVSAPCIYAQVIKIFKLCFVQNLIVHQIEFISIIIFNCFINFCKCYFMARK